MLSTPSWLAGRPTTVDVPAPEHVGMIELNANETFHTSGSASDSPADAGYALC